jgi:hypothetical protein
VGGTSVAFTDNTSGKDISVDLTAKVISTDTIQVLFTADAPGAADAGGQDFLSTVDDAGTPEVSQATTEGNADGDGTDADSWTVTTTDAGCNVLMIVGSGASPNASDLAIATFLTNNGLTVFFADDGDSEAQFEAAIATNDIEAAGHPPSATKPTSWPWARSWATAATGRTSTLPTRTRARPGPTSGL